MKDMVISVYALGLNYALKLVADVPDEQMCAQPVPGRVLNHAAFLLGHLIWAEDSALGLLGQKPVLGPEWRDSFSMGKSPGDDRSQYPSKELLVKTLEEVHGRLVAAYIEATPEILAQPAPERLRARFATIGTAVLGADDVAQVTARGTTLGLAPGTRASGRFLMDADSSRRGAAHRGAERSVGGDNPTH